MNSPKSPSMVASCSRQYFVPETPEEEQDLSRQERQSQSQDISFLSVPLSQSQSNDSQLNATASLDAYDSVRELPATKCRQVYLITYSRADELKVPSREAFVEIILNAFGQENIQKYVCCAEPHAEQGFHYHMAIKLVKDMRWMRVKNSIQNAHDIAVHFQDFVTGYNDAFRYVTKRDVDTVLSSQHDLDESAVGGSQKQPKKTAKRRLDLIEFNDMILKNDIRSDDQLAALCKKRRQQGDPEPFRHYLSMSDAKRVSLISSVWRLEESEARLARAGKSRLELLIEVAEGSCVPDCGENQAWLHRAIDSLQLNNIDMVEFSTDIYNLLDLGRGKGRNILIVGKTNCGKTEILFPLTVIYHCFLNPSSSSFNWVGAEKSECCFLNDMRYTPKLMPLSDFLNLLEGKDVHIPMPKTHYAEDALWTADTPVFATSKKAIQLFNEDGEFDKTETDMMALRWKIHKFKHQHPLRKGRDPAPCGKCFADMVLKFRVGPLRK